MIEHVVYRMFDGEGELLYVGMTMNPTARFGGHRKNKPWWPEVATIALEQHPSRQSAAEAESRAIRRERPRWNSVRYDCGRVRVVRVADNLWEPAMATAALRGDILSEVIRDELERYVRSK